MYRVLRVLKVLQLLCVLLPQVTVRLSRLSGLKWFKQQPELPIPCPTSQESTSCDNLEEIHAVLRTDAQ